MNPENFQFGKAHHQGVSLVKKCLRAVENGDLDGLSKAHFEAALDAIGQAFADDTGVSEDQAYSAILKTKAGAMLYSGYSVAEPAPPKPVEKAAEPPALAEINKRAEELQDRQPELSFERATTEVMHRDPSLYAQYREQTGSGSPFHLL